MTWGLAALNAGSAALSVYEGWVITSIMQGVLAIMFVHLALRSRRTGDRLRRVWRHGRRVVVTVKDWHINAGYWRATTVELEGRVGEVRFRRAPEVGMELPALVLDNEIAVLAPEGVLRAGVLSTS